MIKYFLKHSKITEKVTLNFFEVDQGQSKCDSIIEKNFALVGEVQVPSKNYNDRENCEEEETAPSSSRIGYKRCSGLEKPLNHKTVSKNLNF